MSVPYGPTQEVLHRDGDLSVGRFYRLDTELRRVHARNTELETLLNSKGRKIEELETVLNSKGTKIEELEEEVASAAKACKQSQTELESRAARVIELQASNAYYAGRNLELEERLVSFEELQAQLELARSQITEFQASAAHQAGQITELSHRVASLTEENNRNQLDLQSGQERIIELEGLSAAQAGRNVELMETLEFQKAAHSNEREDVNGQNGSFSWLFSSESASARVQDLEGVVAAQSGHCAELEERCNFLQSSHDQLNDARKRILELEGLSAARAGYCVEIEERLAYASRTEAELRAACARIQEMELSLARHAAQTLALEEQLQSGGTENSPGPASSLLELRSLDKASATRHRTEMQELLAQLESSRLQLSESKFSRLQLDVRVVELERELLAATRHSNGLVKELIVADLANQDVNGDSTTKKPIQPSSRTAAGVSNGVVPPRAMGSLCRAALEPQSTLQSVSVQSPTKPGSVALAAPLSAQPAMTSPAAAMSPSAAVLMRGVSTASSVVTAAPGSPAFPRRRVVIQSASTQPGAGKQGKASNVNGGVSAETVHVGQPPGSGVSRGAPKATTQRVQPPPTTSSTKPGAVIKGYSTDAHAGSSQSASGVPKAVSPSVPQQTYLRALARTEDMPAGSIVLRKP